MIDNEDEKARLLQACRDRALHAHATAFIFERRAEKLRSRKLILTFLGLALPGTVGALVISFQWFHDYLRAVAPVASVLSLVQFGGSLWALVADWDKQLMYSLEAITDNHRLSEAYRRLVEDQPAHDAMRARFDALVREDNDRRRLDYQQGISEKEKRSGMRAGLHQFQRECAGCDSVPASTRPGTCKGGVCGSKCSLK